MEDGQQVRENDLLAMVDSTELELQLKQIQAELASLKGEKLIDIKTFRIKYKSQELLVEKAQLT